MGAVTVFSKMVWEHYQTQGRDLPWRRTNDPYRILVSEIMLQQTQISRVVPKYEEFILAFPDVDVLASASVGLVLRAWQGLGYNRRGLALRAAARILADEYQGRVPRSVAELQRLPGVGPATASAICAFAYNKPLPFIETNIRSAFIHFFFEGCLAVSDADILPLVEATLDRANPREWYYALMDYGAWVKKTYKNPGRRSRHHAVQTPFAGSRRQLRAQVLRLMLTLPGLADDLPRPEVRALGQLEIAARFPHRDPHEVQVVLEDLTREGFLTCSEGRYRVM